MRTIVALVVALAFGASACSSSSPTPLPLAPSLPSARPTPPPAPPPAPGSFEVFADPVSGVLTTDVYDVHGQVVRFNTDGDLIWTATDTRFPGYPVVRLGPGDYIMEDLSWQIRFGTKDGERRAFFAPHDTNLLCDLEVVDGELVITVTDVPLPGA